MSKRLSSQGIRLTALCLGLTVAGMAAALDPKLEERFRRFEDDNAFATIEDSLAELKAMEKLLPKDDAAAWRRWRRLWCWNGHADGTDAAIRYAEQYLPEARTAGDKAAEIDFTLCRGYYHEAMGVNDKALADYDAAYALAQKHNERRLLADAASLRGANASSRGELAQALQDLQIAQRTYESLGLTYWSRRNLADLANTYRRLGDYEKALEYYRQLRQIYELEGDKLALSNVLGMSANALEDLERHEEALSTYRQAAELGLKAGLKPEDATDYLGIGSVLARMGRQQEALVELAAARKYVEKIKNPDGLGLVDLFEGRALAGLGRHDEALARFASAELRFRQADQTRFLAWLQQARRDSLAAKGEWKAAYQEGQNYLQTHESLDRKLRERESSRLRIEFDTERKEAENKQLLLEKSLKDRELQALGEVRRWQWGVIALSVALLLILLVLAVRQIRKARRLHVLAMTDELTQLANRRHIEAEGEEAIRRSREDKRPLSILVFDVDYFKRTNDSYGHGVGDQVLVRVAKASQAVLRQLDRLGRTGGEEFLVVLPCTNLMQAVQVAERLRAGVASVSMADLGAGLATTISIGVAELKPADADLRAITQRADNALYRAKADGRNRVEFES